MADHCDLEEQATHSPNGPTQMPSTPKSEPTVLKSPTRVTMDAAIKVVQFIFTLSFWFPVLVVSVFFTGNAQWIDGRLSRKQVEPSRRAPSKFEHSNTICLRKQPRESRRDKITRNGVVLATRLGCLALVWLAINLSVPSLKRVCFLGSSLWKWSLLAVIILLGTPFKHFALITLIEFADITNKFEGSNVQYWVEGSEASVRSVIYSTGNLLLWMIFFFTHRGLLNPTYQTVHKYIILALVSSLVGAILWLVKSVLLLYWKTKFIYGPHKGKILAAGFQFYFLLRIFENLNDADDEDKDSCVTVGEDSGPQGTADQLIPHKVRTHVEMEVFGAEKGKNHGQRSKTRPIEATMEDVRATLQDIDSVARCLTENFEFTLTEDDDTPGIHPELLSKFKEKHQKETLVTEKSLLIHRKMDESNAKLLMKVLLGGFHEKTSISYEAFEKWLRDAHKDCVSLGHKLNGDFALTTILNRVLIGLIVVLILLLWLFITKLATTGLLVTLGSLFLGLSFAFGDSCKTFVQGFVFSFVNHPLDVGDQCYIDHKEFQLEVKKINILTTTFYGENRKKILIYPNSDLATKCITKYKEKCKVVEQKPVNNGP